jgi:hypothetical protein
MSEGKRRLYIGMSYVATTRLWTFFRAEDPLIDDNRLRNNGRTAVAATHINYVIVGMGRLDHGPQSTIHQGYRLPSSLFKPYLSPKSSTHTINTMSTGQTIFPTPSTANEELTAAAGKSYIATLRQQALAQWWGNFVPIDQWTPPAVKPMFEGQRFQSK